MKAHHLEISRGDIGRYVLLPGDPGRCETISGFLDFPVLIARNREFTTYTGQIAGEDVSVVSTGIGNPSAAIAVEELIAAGADTMIRVGTSGGMQPHQRPGDLAIMSGAIRDEGTTKHYMPPEFPAIADLDVVIALRQAANNLGFRHHIGISHSKDSYFGQMRPESMPVAKYLTERWQAWIQGGAVCAEMETSTLFVLSSLYRIRAGSITLIAINQSRPEWGIDTDSIPMIQTAVDAVDFLIKQDKVENL
jgi:uridine phosphorylase